MTRSLFFCLVASTAIVAASQVTPAEPSLPPPTVKIPVPKPEIAFASISKPILRRTVIWTPEIYLGWMRCGGFDLAEPEFPAFGLIDLFGSVEDYRTALEAQKIELVELQPISEEVTMPAEKSGTAIVLENEDAGALRAILTHDAAYDWKAESPVLSRDGYRVKFSTSTRVVMLDLFLSARCARTPSSARVPASSRFDFGYATIASIINRHFPGATD